MSLVVLVGPAGVGKGSLVKLILDKYEDFMLSVSATTRAPRQDEVDGVQYHFVSRDRFEEMISANELLEHATVHGQHLYGTPRAELERASSLGKHLILEIDLQGARRDSQARARGYPDLRSSTLMGRARAQATR